MLFFGIYTGVCFCVHISQGNKAKGAVPSPPSAFAAAAAAAAARVSETLSYFVSEYLVILV